MRIFITLIAIIGFAPTVIAQDFVKAMANAKASYSAGKLEETHFALQQAMQEVDLTIGKEVLKLLPQKIDVMEISPKQDNISSNVGYVGATIHRAYEKVGRKSDITIISNSPLVAVMNTTLNTPLLGGFMNDDNTKTVKVQGYKGRLEKQLGSANDKNSYELQIPLGSALITFKVDDCTDTQILNFADTIPLQQIAKLIQ
jgi:hypothetical protein